MMLEIGKLTDAQYDLLSACFKNGFTSIAISEFAGISYERVKSERRRWRLCNQINNLEVVIKPTWNRTHPSNSSKVFSY